LTKDLIIENVLYLPQFVVNLISVSTLCEEQDCILQFETNMCIIQERKGLRKIGSAEKKHGLYYLLIDDRQHEVSVSSVLVLEEPSKNNVPAGVLWHLRLGHLSQDRMLSLNKVYSYIDVSLHTACDLNVNHFGTLPLYYYTLQTVHTSGLPKSFNSFAFTKLKLSLIDRLTYFNVYMGCKT